MSGIQLPRRVRPVRRRRRWVYLIAALCVAAIVLEVGFVTDWFGLASRPAGTSANPPSTGTNPNPFNQTVRSVTASVSYRGSAAGSFPALDGTNLCPECPALPRADYSASPPEAVFSFYVNVTNTGTAFALLANFSLRTVNYAGAGPFALRAVLCCSPTYSEGADSLGFLPGQTLGLAGVAYATYVPDNGPLGYELAFSATSP